MPGLVDIMEIKRNQSRYRFHLIEIENLLLINSIKFSQYWPEKAAFNKQ